MVVSSHDKGHVSNRGMHAAMPSCTSAGNTNTEDGWQHSGAPTWPGARRLRDFADGPRSAMRVSTALGTPSGSLLNCLRMQT